MELSPSASVGLCEDNASEFSPKHPGQGVGGEGGCTSQNWHKLRFVGSNWGVHFQSLCLCYPQTLSKATLQGAEPGQLLSSGSVHRGKISDCDCQLAVDPHDCNSGELKSF